MHIYIHIKLVFGTRVQPLSTMRVYVFSMYADFFFAYPPVARFRRQYARPGGHATESTATAAKVGP